MEAKRVGRLTKRQLREHLIGSPYDIAKAGPEPQVSIVYVAADRGRGDHGAYWVVYRVGYQTDPGGPWYYRGHKVFTLFQRSKEEALRLGPPNATASGMGLRLGSVPSLVLGTELV